MDALEILAQVASTYKSLSSYEVEIRSTMESGNDDDSSMRSQRAQAFFVAPDKTRIDKAETVVVCNGSDRQRYFKRPGHYWMNAVGAAQPIVGMFNPDFPWGGEPFLFHRIVEYVVRAAILREEDDAYVIAVTYPSSEVTFWINRRTNLVLRMDGEFTPFHPARRMPPAKHSYRFTNSFLNQTIPLQTFEYCPPADAIAPGFQRPGSRLSFHPEDERKGFDTFHHAAWEEETLVENFELNIRGTELVFTRRFFFEGDLLRVAEKVTNAKGTTECELKISI